MKPTIESILFLLIRVHLLVKCNDIVNYIEFIVLVMDILYSLMLQPRLLGLGNATNWRWAITLVSNIASNDTILQNMAWLVKMRLQ